MSLTDTSIPSGVRWRRSIDRAWSSAELRRMFESESGLAPLESEDGAVRELQLFTGYQRTYHERFVSWATKHLDMENLVPEGSRQVLDPPPVKLG